MGLPPLNALKAFDAAARHGSFKLAAAELCISIGAVSRHVAHLEAHLGVSLFERQHRRIQLTKHGLDYHRSTKGALSAISAATQDVIGHRSSRPLRLKVPPSCAVRWLVPRLKRFNARYPEIAIEISTAHEPADFDSDDLDAAVLYGDEVDPRLSASRLFDEVLVPVMSPELARRSPQLRSPHDFGRMVLLHSLHMPTAWSQLFSHAGLGELKVPAGHSFENTTVTYQAAIEGVGVAVLQAAFVLGELLSGRLIVPFGLHVHNSIAYRFVLPKARAHPRSVRQFGAWIAEEARLTREMGAAYGI